MLEFESAGASDAYAFGSKVTSALAVPTSSRQSSKA
jgi:hypothetical protein